MYATCRRCNRLTADCQCKGATLVPQLQAKICELQEELKEPRREAQKRNAHATAMAVCHERTRLDVDLKMQLRQKSDALASMSRKLYLAKAETAAAQRTVDRLRKAQD